MEEGGNDFSQPTGTAASLAQAKTKVCFLANSYNKGITILFRLGSESVIQSTHDFPCPASCYVTQALSRTS